MTTRRSDLDSVWVLLGMASRVDQHVAVPVEDLIKVTTELEAIRELLRAIREALVRMTPAAMEVISQLAQADRSVQ